LFTPQVVFWGVWRVQGILAVSRAIGDKGLKRFVTGTPEIESCLLSSNDVFVVLASDGIWDMLSNEEVGKICMTCGDINNASKQLVEEAFNRGSQDNMTAMVIDLRNHKVEHDVEQMPSSPHSE
jgi:protein phosphatase 1L